MPDRDLPGIATTAKVGEHPLHPMLIPFPIALLVATLACDVVFWATENTFWADAAFWSLTAAIVTALVAAVAGLTDFFGNRQIRALSDAWQHMLGNVLAVALAVVNLWMRYADGAAEAVFPWGITLSAVIVLMLLYTGWKGGTLVYHHRIGMQPEAPSEHASPYVTPAGIERR